MSSYRDSFRNAVLDPDSIVLVVEDTLDQKESIHVYDALEAAYPPFDEQIPKDMLENGKAIVSAATFSLLPHSARHGQFQPQPEGDNPKAPDGRALNRDKNPIASQIMNEVLHPQEVETFKGRMVIDMMVTHPAYWRRGHATLITEWFIELAKLDGIGLGVAGAPMGKIFFAAQGFKEAKTVEIPGYEMHPEPIFAWLGVLNVTKEEPDATRADASVEL